MWGVQIHKSRSAAMHNVMVLIRYVKEQSKIITSRLFRCLSE